MGKDLRHYAKQTNTRLLIGFFVLLFVVGDGLIAIIYGKEAALLGLLCILGGIAPLVLIGLGFFILDRIVKKANDE